MGFLRTNVVQISKGLLAALAGVACIAARADVVLYDAAVADGRVRIDGGTVAVDGSWDLSDCGEMAFELDASARTNAVTYLRATLENDGSRKANFLVGVSSRGIFALTVLTEGQDRVLRCPIPPRMPGPLRAVAEEMTGIRLQGLFHRVWPSSYWSAKEAGSGNSIKDWSLDPSRVVRLRVENCLGNRPLPLRRVVARGKPNVVTKVPEFAKIPPERFFPCIDRYGQFKWSDWPGKVKNDADLAAAKAAEDADLAAHPGPAGRDKWGGWAEGPRLEATGHFRVQKVRGKWWFVDPDGHLWWSHGPLRVSASCGMTPVKGRERLFEFLPEEGTPLAAFYKTRDELMWPYYVKRGVTNTFDFTAANMYRKYGDDWRNVWMDRVHRRLKSWGANTIANSSDARVMGLSRTPYCDRIEIKSRPIAGTKKLVTWWPFRDPFDPSFRADVRRQLAERRAALEDPWCFGLFVDNELCWGGVGDLARRVWESPEDQPARVEFCRYLKERHGSVPETPSDDDFAEFSKTVARAYFSGVRDEFKRMAPNKLYLGCRFCIGHADFIKRIAAEYSDVMSFNFYDRDILKFHELPDGVDKPVIIGEFHFGALDRGPINPGIIWLKDQNERAITYRRYLESALRDPNIVGTHWHQYADDVTTGRFDGENFQNGWVDICDNPYPETISAVRWIGDNMYDIRFGKESKEVVP